MSTEIVTPACQAVPSNSDGEAWRQSVKRAIRDPRELCRRLELRGSEAEQIVRGSMGAAESFPLFVPQEFLRRIRPGDPQDPLLLQVVPQLAEGERRSGESRDPVGDLAAQQAPGLLQKYAGRVLLVVTGACAAHCRYCFRKAFPYAEALPHVGAWELALGQIAADPTIREVLLSGGDPLMVPDRPLAELVERVTAIRHLRRLRIHTRLPVLIPSRVTERLLAYLTSGRLKSVVVVHVNHPAEIDDDVAAGLARLVDAGILVLNQSVLLRQVNDSVDTLTGLSERLLDVGVLPYYLHQLDPVVGTSHFAVPIDEGQRLVEQLRSRLPGYAVPRYVQEQAGQPSKTVLA